MILHYIFDIDDTLYLERDYVRSGFKAVAQTIGRPEFGDVCLELFEQGVRRNTFNIALQKMPVAFTVAQLVEIYRRHAPDITLCRDAKIMLQSLPLPCGVISDGPPVSQRAKYQALGLVPWIDCPIFTGEIHVPKPSAEPFILAAYAFNAPPELCAYIADNPEKDFAGAKACHMTTIRIRRHGALHENAPSGGDVDREIRDLRELLP